MRRPFALLAIILAGCGQPATPSATSPSQGLPGASTAPWLNTLIPNGRRSGILIHKEINDIWDGLSKHGGNEFLIREAKNRYTETLNSLRGVRVDFPLIVNGVSLDSVSVRTMPIDPDYNRKLEESIQRGLRGEHLGHLSQPVKLDFDFSGKDHGLIHYQYNRLEEVQRDIPNHYLGNETVRMLRENAILSVIGTIVSATTYGPDPYNGPQINPLLSIKIDSVYIVKK